MSALVFTQYSNCKSVTGVTAERAWDDWVGQLSNRKIRTSKDGPALVLGHVEGRRAKKNVTSVHAIGLDIDGASQQTIVDAIKQLRSFECFIYTTHSHNQPDKGTRLRVIVPLAVPIPPGDHFRVWSWLNALLGGVVDEATKDASRLHYLPSAPPDARGHVSLRNQGEMLDPSTIKGAAPNVEPERPTLTDAQRVETRETIIKYLRHTRTEALRAAGKLLLEGAPFAKKEQRHNTMRNVTWLLSKKFANAPTDIIVEIFRPSIVEMQRTQDDAPTLDAVAKAWEGAISKRQTEIWALQRKGAPEYTEQEIATIKEVQGVDDLDSAWVVQKDTNFYVLAHDGYYRGPFTVNEARAAALTVLRRAPVPMTVNSQTGPRRRGIQEIVETHGAVASKIVADLSKQGSSFDERTGIMYEAVCPRRPIEPAPDKRIEEWLHIFGGEYYDKLTDWLACVPDTNRLLCALYLAGHPGSGKTLLAHGLARIWTTGSITELHNVMADFNEELAYCPVVIGDEALPKTWRGNSITTKLRSMVSVTHRTLNRKHRAPADLVGAIRLILTANNEFLLESDGASSAQDLAAIAQRFLYIPTNEEASNYLDALPQSVRDQWLTGDGIAAHVLHLHATRDVRTHGRFAVQGDVTSMHRLLLTSTYWNSMVCEWLVRYLMNPTSMDRRGDGLIRRDTGRLLVNDQALIDGWELYLKTHKDPDTAKIGQALRTISKNDRVQLRYNGKRIRYREIDLEHLCAWSDQHNIADNRLIVSLGEDQGQDDSNGNGKVRITDDFGSVATVNSRQAPM